MQFEGVIATGTSFLKQQSTNYP